MTLIRATIRATAKLLAIVAVAAPLAIGAAAFGQEGPPNALQGFSANRNKPVRIQAASLEVRDRDKVATFSGDVHVVQGDTDLRCKTLLVYYEQGVGSGKAAQAGPGGGQIRRMEARGNVVVTQKDQVATGDQGDFDMRTNTVTLTGNVVVTKGQDVLRGQRLVVNLTDGVSKMDSRGGPVDMIVYPRSDQKSGLGQSRPARPARKN